MGDNPETDNEILDEVFTVEANDTKDVLIFMPTCASEVFGVKVSVEICSQVSLEDKRCDLIIELTEAITQTMVGRFGLRKKMHLQEYLGTLRLTSDEVMEVS